VISDRGEVIYERNSTKNIILFENNDLSVWGMIWVGSI